MFSTEDWQTVLAGEQVSGHNGFSSGFSYKTNWSAVQIAAANGCNWCRLLTKPKSRQDGEYEVEYGLPAMKTLTVLRPEKRC